MEKKCLILMDIVQRLIFIGLIIYKVKIQKRLMVLVEKYYKKIIILHMMEGGGDFGGKYNYTFRRY